MTTRRVCIVTGSRADYGHLRPVIRAIKVCEALELHVAATGELPGIGALGSPLGSPVGSWISQEEREAFSVAEIEGVVPDDDTPQAMGRAVGRGIGRFIDYFQEHPADVAVVLGDRTEAFAAATAAVFSRICLAHLHGGDRTRGGFDESMRHAITKLAHIHFTATEKSAERIIKMGEDPEHVHVVGTPGLDDLSAGPFEAWEDLAGRWGMAASQAPIVVVQHPVSTRPEDAPEEVRATMNAVTAAGRPTVVVLPNTDAGGRRAIELIGSYEQGPRLRCFNHLDRPVFLSLLKCAAVLVGNSSSGIIEAPSFRLPVVNIGERQAGRECAENVIHVEPDREAIAAAIETALTDSSFRQKAQEVANPYGDGHASERIVAVLERVSLDHELIQKQITY
jgi:UDP-N-acetylglucosamine 2-epimerase (non-hydrolysing)/GDP/UDP-N,N'-diacetylbacillosamine 2-epimerase (hydrolysing)